MPDHTLLCGQRGKPGAVTVRDYKRWLLEPDQGWSKKPDFIRQRLSERYIDPVQRMNPSDKNGFMIMAICCLFVETLESFWRGWPSSKDKSKEAFRLFFRRQPRFSVVKNDAIANEFYDEVRCGILHQGETRNGWTILRGGAMFDDTNKRINATAFHRAVQGALADYVQELDHSAPGSKLRRRFDGKMMAVINNCG